MTNTEMTMIAGMDIGNGYVKGKISINGNKPRRIDLPSCIAYTGRSAWLPADADDAYMEELINELDCDIKSNALKPLDEGRILVGNRAVSSGRTPVVFSIDDHKPKCDDSLSVQLILSSLAGAALEEYYREEKELPTSSLQVKVAMGIALPFSDYLQYHTRYHDMFVGGTHTVHIHNFASDVTVNIEFEQVVVLAEGQAAQYAIAELGADFLDAALEECRESGAQIDDSITGEVLETYENTVGIDIGEGTVNYPVFRNGRIAVELSSSINKGYGNVLENVIAAVRNESYAPETRKELEQQLRDENPKPHMKRIQERLADFEADEARELAREIIAEYKSVISRVKFSADVVYVFGGGATRMHDLLYPQLLEASKLDYDSYIPVIYMSSDYSRDLNRNGLYQVAKLAAEQQ